MEVIEVIKQCSADGNVLRLPKMELSREDYLAVKKAVEKNGGNGKVKRRSVLFSPTVMPPMS